MYMPRERVSDIDVPLGQVTDIAACVPLGQVSDIAAWNLKSTALFISNL